MLFEQVLDILSSVDFYQSMFRLATPLMLASMGDIVSERSGVLNMSLEGMMLIGAFFAFVGSSISGNPWIGLLVAVVCALLVGMLHSFCCISLGINQGVVAVAINILCSGLCGTMMRTLYGSASAVPRCRGFGPLPVPGLSNIPFIGEALFAQHWLTYLSLILIPITWIFFYKTMTGLKIRAVGENPKAVNSIGVNVVIIRYACVLYSAVLAGLAGVSLSICGLNTYVDNLVAGRGYVAFAAVIFGKFHPVGAALGAMLFGFADTLQLNIQALGLNIPYQVMLTLPYLMTLAVMFLMSAGTAPKGWAIPYLSERRN
ncbi:MAG: ABC transporter permease [Zhaonellaceae bacterium]|jgi:ABC-type uncharacterized transport system permease subunit|nr:ABC transporter permease [Clostridia bacterium]